VRVRDLHVERPIRLVYPEKRVLSHAARAFWELIQERVAG
jgi:DNA-binding transcriptional LysR family regulator